MKEASEKIGKVLLDLSAWPGEDLYTDGAVEEMLLSVAKENAPSDAEAAALAKRDFAALYHFSHIRENILTWYPFTGEENVLEVGSGCGALTGALAERCRSVTCVDLSRKRSEINAWRNRERENVTIRVGNFEDAARSLTPDFDMVTLIGVLEYAASFISGKDPFVSFLQQVRSFLKPGGVLLLAIENRLGLKYFAGCAEDHTGRYFDGIEGYPEGGSARTFSKGRLQETLREAGFPRQTFYYPYPDYKFPQTIYSDRFLPRPGELSRNIVNYDRERLVLFDETRAFDAMIEEGLFPLFANSFLVEAETGEMA